MTRHRDWAHMHYARLASDALMNAVTSGPFGFLADVLHDQPQPEFDLRFRGSPKFAESEARMYFIGAGVLQLFESDGSIRVAIPQGRDGEPLSALAEACRFDVSWARARPAAEWASTADEIRRYLDRTRDHIKEGRLKGVSREGRPQAALCAGNHALTVLDRETAFVFDARSDRRRVIESIRAPLLEALQPLSRSPHRAKLRESMGGEIDAVAIDPAGRLLAIEVKPAGEIGTAGWAPAQATLYAQLLGAWVADIGQQQARAILHEMARQRAALGYDQPHRLGDRVEVIPVVAIEKPADPEAERCQAIVRPLMKETAAALGRLRPTVEYRTIHPDGAMTELVV